MVEYVFNAPEQFGPQGVRIVLLDYFKDMEETRHFPISDEADTDIIMPRENRHPEVRSQERPLGVSNICILEYHKYAQMKLNTTNQLPSLLGRASSPPCPCPLRKLRGHS